MNLLVYFTQLRNAIGRESQPLYAGQIFRTGVSLLRRLERFPNRPPNLMLLPRIRRLWNRLPGLIAECKLGNAVTPRSVFEITKARMVGAELNDTIAVCGSLIGIQWNDTHISVVGQ